MASIAVLARLFYCVFDSNYGIATFTKWDSGI